MRLLRPLALASFLVVAGSGCAALIGADFDRPAGGEVGGGNGSGGSGAGAATSCSSEASCPDPGPCRRTHCDLAAGTCGSEATDEGARCVSPAVSDGVCTRGICAGKCDYADDCAAVDCNDVVCTEGRCVYRVDAKLHGARCSGAEAGKVCDAAGKCVDACQDGKQDGDEREVDCGGGTCAGCPNSTSCLAGADCDSGYCDAVCGPWAVAVAAGGFGACAVTNAGKIKCWGDGSNGELGDGRAHVSAVPVALPAFTGGIHLVSAGVSDACAIDAGALSCWGWNRFGEIESTGSEHATPVVAKSLSSGVTAGAIGFQGGCAIVAGALKCWCSVGDGSCGNGSASASQAPVAVLGVSDVGEVSAGSGFNCARLASGVVKCWGANAFAQLGDGSYGHADCAGVGDCSGTPVTVGGVSGAIAIAAGSGSTPSACAVVADGAVFCWGDNGTGQLGDAQTHHDCSGHDCSATAVQVANLTDAARVAVGGAFACALTEVGAVKCWGDNAEGQLGDGTTESRPTPVAVVGLGDVTAISAGADFACAVTKAGGVKCWGSQKDGRLGNGGKTGSSARPVTVVLP